MTTTTLTLSLIPGEVLSSNARLHWARKARATAHLRTRAAMAYRLAGSPQMTAARCVVTIAYPDKRAHDQMCDLAETLLPAPQPTAVHPADVRVGDRVRVEWKPEEATVTDVVDSDVGLLADYGATIWVSLTGDRHDRADLYLLDRPEPEDPRVAVVKEWPNSTREGPADLLARLDAARADR